MSLSDGIYRGKWGDAAREGRLFTGSSAAAGLVLPIYSATAQLFGLWNPSNSGVNAYLVNVAFSYVSTTGAAGGYCLGLLANVGSAVATAAPISAFTDAAPYRGFSSNTGGNKVRFTGSAATVTTALMAIGRQLGLSQTAIPATDATNMFVHSEIDFDGEVMLAPNTAMFLCGNISTLMTNAPSVTWVEDVI